MCYKGIVVKIKKNYAIVLSEDNEYKRIRLKNNLVVGQKIMYTNDDIVHNQQKLRMMTIINKKSIAVAAVLLLIVSGSLIGINNFMSQRAFKNVIALITVDINPSVKVSVNEDDKVVKVESLNDDGETLNLSGVIGIDVDEVIETIVSKARVAGFINNEDLEDDYVLITMIPVEEEEKEKVEEIEDLIKEKIVESDELQNVNVAMIKATMNQLSEAQDKSIPAGLLAANGGASDDELMSVKDFFASEERIAVFENTGEIIEKDLEKEIELIGKYLNELEVEDVNIKNLQATFDLSKEDFFEAKKLYELAKKEYKHALASGDEEKIASAKLLMEEAEKYKDSMEQNKDDVELIKEQIKRQLEALETDVDTEEQKQEEKKHEEEENRLEEKQKREEEKHEEEENRLEEKQKREEEKHEEEENRLEEKEKREEEQHEKEEKRLEEKEKRDEEEREKEEKRLEEKEKRKEEQHEKEEKRLEEKEKREEEQQRKKKSANIVIKWNL
ncbi:anti-sigma factor domain-containing protein [Sedimentibacter sp. zth1]|uniref:anti-sigma factor domain-containing protein n=1 Tax=Sedimentibacter sp. zth1 TaxID=2816908 RepID=UPI001A936A74|nr:anti-sigma factor domain-containing protein [Sedimentibacter sp. zth1]QSX05643.1 anti-sigma factor domain-containing protein [Sedimentibacter sp. zth1]